MGFDPQPDEFAPLMEAVARATLGEPNKALSRPDELRFGSKGAISVIPSKGVYHDWHDDSGGGVLQFVQTYSMMTKSEALEFLRGFGLAKREDRAVQADKPRRRIHSVYDYVDEHGELLFQVVRWADGEPRFQQRRPDPDNADKWIWSTKDVRKIPYRLPELIEALAHERPVWIVEGEKDVDNLARLGIAATCNPGGAGKFPQPCIDALKGAHVVLCPDNDDAGRKHVEFVQSALAGIAASITRVTLPGLPEKGDVSDFIEQHPDNPADAIWREFERQSREPQPEAPAEERKRLEFIPFCEIDAHAKPSDYIIKNVLPKGGVAFLHGDSQAGKSFLVINMAIHIAWGRDWFGHRVREGGVLYQCGEGEGGIPNRLVAARNAMKAPYDLPIGYLPEQVDLWNASGDTDKFIEAIKIAAAKLTAPLSLIVVDTHAQASAGADENKAEHMTALLKNYKKISRATGATILIIHHRNAEGSKMRGHTSLFGAADTVVEVTIEDEHTGIRQWRTEKQKDGRNNITGRFDLMAIELCRDSDGDPFTSCYVDEIKEKKPESSQATSDKAAPRLPAAPANALKSLQAAMGQRWETPPEDMTVPRGVNRVVKYSFWQDAFFRSAFPPNAAKGTKDKAFGRAWDVLMAQGYFVASGDYVWLTEKGATYR